MWSRYTTDKHRLTYEIIDSTICRAIARVVAELIPIFAFHALGKQEQPITSVALATLGTNFRRSIGLNLTK
jgi:hypothetical protein